MVGGDLKKAIPVAGVQKILGYDNFIDLLRMAFGSGREKPPSFTKISALQTPVFTHFEFAQRLQPVL